MQLIYLWIDEYKNIKQEGFNLSDNYDCNFNTETEDVTIEEKKEKLNIFNNNINLKAIIGKNGSGKSSLIESVLLLLMNRKVKNFNGFLVFKDSLGFNILGNKSIKININGKNTIGHSFENNHFSLYINYGLDTLSETFFKKSDIRTNRIFYLNNRNNIYAIPNKNYRRIYLDKINSDLASDYYDVKYRYNLRDDDIEKFFQKYFKDKNFIFTPYKIKLELDKNDFLNRIDYPYIFDNRKINLRDFFNNINFKLNDSNFKEQLFFLGVLYIIFYNLKNFRIDNERFYNENSIERFRDILHPLINDLIGMILNLTTQYRNRKNYNELWVKIFENKYEIIESLEKYFNNSESKKVINYLEFVVNEKKGIDWFKRDVEYSEGISKEFLEKLPGFIKIRITDKIGRKFETLSFGERLLNHLFFKVLASIGEKKEYLKEFNTLNIIYDEFDVGMHPEMQRRFVKFLIAMLNFIKEKFYDIKQFNIILATHSPFILSDIPKENVIFLENGKSVGKFDKNENSFGANIYDIFEKGFFLENSIGAYSEEIIKSTSLILSFYNSYHLARKGNIFPLRQYCNKWYKTKDGELSDDEKENQDKEFLKEIKEDKIKYIEKKFEKNNIEFEKYKELFIDENNNLKEEIEKYIKIIGDPVVRNHLLTIYEEVKNESK
jgi:Fe-S cluster assembly ATPase SufC